MVTAITEFANNECSVERYFLCEVDSLGSGRNPSQLITAVWINQSVSVGRDWQRRLQRPFASQAHFVVPFSVSESSSTTSDPVAIDRTIVGMMAKFWSVGSVKTRLGKSIGMHQAALLHKRFVQVLTNRLADVAAQRIAVVAPQDKANRFAAQISSHWTIAQQSDGDLGHRMMTWFSEVLPVCRDSEPHAAVLIGADCPTIDARAICEAAECLESNDVVIGPAIDGGYYLIGMRGPWRPEFASLFEAMPWSTDEVFERTIERIAAAALRVATLKEREDIDTIESLDRLRTELRKDMATNGESRILLQQIDAILSGGLDS